MKLVMTGLDHKRADIEIREKFAHTKPADFSGLFISELEERNRPEA